MNGTDLFRALRALITTIEDEPDETFFGVSADEVLDNIAERGLLDPVVARIVEHGATTEGVVAALLDFSIIIED